MSISRTKFTAFFIIFGFVFLFVTTSLLGSTGPRGFPQAPDSVLRTGNDSPEQWKSTASKIIFPIKVVLIGPLGLPQINFLKDDPPPPFIGIYLIFYWTILSLILHYLISRIKYS